MQIKIDLFGIFRLTQNGRVKNFVRKKSKGLLAYLILYPKPHSRERLATMFWSESDMAGARRALRVSLAEIRSILGDEVVIGEQESIRINPNVSILVDVFEFQSVSKWSSKNTIDDLIKRIKLYKGDFLEEFYDEWVLQLREKYYSMYINSLLQGSNVCRTAGNYAQAIEFAQQVLQDEPFNETACQHLMVCYAAQGDIESAIRSFEVFQKRLFDEFSNLPSPEIQKLYSTLQKQKVVSSSLHHITNVPQATTSFIGRLDEIENIKKILISKNTDSILLTLRGPGGVGKSRLALEIARQGLSDYPDGVWWVDLAQISEANYVAQTVARICGVKEKPNQNVLDTLTKYFASKKILLILDNCEHLLSGCADVAEKILRACKQVHILATSREPLQVITEKVFVLQAMPLPQQEKMDVRALLNNEAVKLFVDRASFIPTSFQSSANNIYQIAEICKKLDGFPLAIELIAAQAHERNLEDINREISRFYKNKRTKPTNQITLRDTIQWSYDLLNETEKTLFRRLAVFAGYWSEEQVVQIAGGYFDASVRLLPQANQNQNYVLPITVNTVIRASLMSLASKSLINLQSRNDNMQFVMLDTIRQFAFEKLIGHSELSQASFLHVNYYLNQLHNSWGKMYTSNEKETLNWIEADYSNIRLALSYALNHKKLHWTKNNIATLGRFWTLRAHFREGRYWFLKLLKHKGLQKQDIPRATMLNNAGLIAWEQGDQKQARAWFNETIKIQKKINDQASLSLTLCNYGNTFYNEGQYNKALPYYEESLKLARKTKNERALSIVTNNLAAIMMEKNKFKRSEKLMEESYEIRKKMGDKRGMGHVLNNLGDLNAMQGDLAKARKYFEESLLLRAEIQEQTGILTPLLNLANLFSIKKIKIAETTQILGYVDSVVEKTGIKLSAEAIQATKEIKESVKKLTGDATYVQKYNQGKQMQIEQIIKLVKN